MFTWIETFLVVYETKSFTLASEQLFISQPTVSVHIQKLENYLGTPLFIRGGNHQLLATEQADFFYPKFQLLKEEWFYLMAIGKKTTPRRHKVTIACSNTTALYLWPKLMPDLLEKFPLLDFNLIKTNSQDVQSLLETHQADVGFIEDDLLSPQLERTFLFKDEPVLCGDFSSNYWLMREEHSGNHVLHERFLKEQTQQPSLIYVNDNEMMLSLLKEGIGQTILSRLALLDSLPYRPLAPSLSRSFYLLARQTIKDPRLVQLVTYLKECLESRTLADFIQKSRN